MKLTDAQWKALRSVDMWAEKETYMPYADQVRPFEACERKGLLEYRSVSNGSPYNGYALTPAGIAYLKERLRDE